MASNVPVSDQQPVSQPQTFVLPSDCNLDTVPDSIIDETEFEIINETDKSSEDEAESERENGAVPAWSLQKSISLKPFPDTIVLNSLSHVVTGIPASVSVATLTTSTIKEGDETKQSIESQNDAMVTSQVETAVLQASLIGPQDSLSIVQMPETEPEKIVTDTEVHNEADEFRSACASPAIQTMSSTVSSADTLNETVRKQQATYNILVKAISTLTSMSDEEMKLAHELSDSEIPLDETMEILRKSAELTTQESELLKQQNEVLLNEVHKREGVQKKLDEVTATCLQLKSELQMKDMEIEELKKSRSAAVSISAEPSLVMLEHVSQTATPPVDLTDKVQRMTEQLEERNKTIHDLKLQLDEATARYLEEVERRKVAEMGNFTNNWALNEQMLAKQLADKNDYALALEAELKKVRETVSTLQESLKKSSEELGNKEEIIKILQEDHTEGTRQLAEKDQQLREKDDRLAEVHRVLERYNRIEDMAP